MTFELTKTVVLSYAYIIYQKKAETNQFDLSSCQAQIDSLSHLVFKCVIEFFEAQRKSVPIFLQNNVFFGANFSSLDADHVMRSCGFFKDILPMGCRFNLPSFMPFGKNVFEQRQFKQKKFIFESVTLALIYLSRRV